MSTTTETLAEFIARVGVTSHAEPAKSNPNIDPSGWDTHASHWLVTLRRSGRELSVPFSQGSAHTEPPTAEDVLDCLASDSAGVDYALFEDWCSEYGYDTDSRKAQATFEACERQALGLLSLLGGTAYDELLWHVERL